MAGILDAVKILTGSAMVLPNAVTLCIVSPIKESPSVHFSCLHFSVYPKRCLQNPKTPDNALTLIQTRQEIKCLLTSYLLLVVLLPSLQAWAEGRQHQELLHHRPKLTTVLSKVTERLLKIKSIAQRVSDWEKPHKLNGTYEFMVHCY